MSGGSARAQTIAGLSGYSVGNYVTTVSAAQGNAAGFWLAFLITVPSQSVTSHNRRPANNRASGGWTTLVASAYSSFQWAAALTSGGLTWSPLVTIAAGDVGKVLMFVGVMDGTSVRVYNKRAEVGSGTSMGGVAHAPNTLGGVTIGQQASADYFDEGGIIHGLAYGTGVPTLGQVQAYYDDVKATGALTSMSGVTTSNVWVAGETTFTDSVGGVFTSTTGSLTYSLTTAPTWSW